MVWTTVLYPLDRGEHAQAYHTVALGVQVNWLLYGTKEAPVLTGKHGRHPNALRRTSPVPRGVPRVQYPVLGVEKVTRCG